MDNQRGRGGPPGPYRGGPPGRGGPLNQPRSAQGPGPMGGYGPGPMQPMAGPDRRIRYFMALCDYDPTTMSPNPDACEEELPFNEGDCIKVGIIRYPDNDYSAI